jgi:hypothetical protein
MRRQGAGGLSVITMARETLGEQVRLTLCVSRRSASMPAISFKLGPFVGNGGKFTEAQRHHHGLGDTGGACAPKLCAWQIGWLAPQAGRSGYTVLSCVRGGGGPGLPAQGVACPAVWHVHCCAC